MLKTKVNNTLFYILRNMKEDEEKYLVNRTRNYIVSGIFISKGIKDLKGWFNGQKDSRNTYT